MAEESTEYPTIEIRIKAVCPACSAHCESLYIGSTDLYADDKVMYRGFRCVNEDLCRKNWEKFKYTKLS